MLVEFTSGSSAAEWQLCHGEDEIREIINPGSSDRLPGRPHFPAALAQTGAFADWTPLERRVGWGWVQARGTVGRRRPSVETPFCGAAEPRRRFWDAEPLLPLLRSLWGVSAAAVHYAPVIFAVGAVP